MSCNSRFDLNIYEDSKIKIILAYHGDKVLILVYVWKEGKKGFELGSWIPYYSVPGNEGVKSVDFLKKNDICLLDIGYKYILIGVETKVHNKLILVDKTSGSQIVGSMFNKSPDESKEISNIHNYIKYLESKYI